MVSIPQRYDTTHYVLFGFSTHHEFQFLKGTIRHESKDCRFYALGQFQFLKGTIRLKTIKLNALTRKGFNSSKVRYDQIRLCPRRRVQIVSIPQRYDTTRRNHVVSLHSLLVSIPQRYDTTTVNTAS